MENVWWLYLLTVIPKIGSAAFGLMFISALTCGVLVATTEDTESLMSSIDSVWPKLKKCITCFFIFGAIFILTPNQEGLMFIVGGSTVIEAAKTDAAKHISQKSVAVVEKWLDDQLGKNAKEKK